VRRGEVKQQELDLLVNWIGAIVRAWEFAGENLHGGAHDQEGVAGPEDGEVLWVGSVDVSIVTGGIAVPLACWDLDLMLARVLHDVAQGFFDRVPAANDAGVKAVGEDFACAVEESIDGSAMRMFRPCMPRRRASFLRT
jgi:hypothetical protein